MPLQSLRFAGQPTLEACAAGKYRMQAGEPDKDAVRRIQRALLALAYPMPKYGADGGFGAETALQVSAFKTDVGLSPADPVVGVGTMCELDRLFAGLPADIEPTTTGPCPEVDPPPVAPPPRVLTFRKFGFVNVGEPKVSQTAGLTPARDLKLDEAWRELAGYHRSGEIVMTPAPTFGPDNAPVVPKSIPKVNLTDRIATVQMRYNPSGLKKGPYQAVPLLSLDVRNACGLVRFIDYLVQRWGVTEVHHSGLWRPKDKPDCHSEGRAFDFNGVAGEYAGQCYSLHVEEDWYGRPVPAPHQKLGRQAQWSEGPGIVTSYRLAMQPIADQLAYAFFADIYTWFATQYLDHTPTSSIGTDSFIMTPITPRPRSHTGWTRRASRSARRTATGVRPTTGTCTFSSHLSARSDQSAPVGSRACPTSSCASSRVPWTTSLPLAAAQSTLSSSLSEGGFVGCCADCL